MKWSVELAGENVQVSVAPGMQQLDTRGKAGLKPASDTRMVLSGRCYLCHDSSKAILPLAHVVSQPGDVFEKPIVSPL